MNTILVADIFGLTPALIKLSHTLKAETIVDPYQGQQLAFDNEADAYAYFIESVGFDVYLAELQRVVSLAPANSTLIGFSIGATILWRLSETVSASRVKRGIGFYGGQIRKFTDIKPQFDVELVFPKSEPHFSIDDLQSTLEKISRVKTLSTNYYHGFMNVYSTNYHESAYNQQIQRLRTILEQ